jgi:hypothetical protein
MRLPIGFGSERERLPDRAADRQGIGADTVEPAARLARARGGTAAHRRDHRFELVNRADAAFISDGIITGTGIECGMKVRTRIDLLKGRMLGRPISRGASHPI